MHFLNIGYFEKYLTCVYIMTSFFTVVDPLNFRERCLGKMCPFLFDFDILTVQHGYQ